MASLTTGLRLGPYQERTSNARFGLAVGFQHRAVYFLERQYPHRANDPTLLGGASHLGESTNAVEHFDG